jgi:acyl-CoA reductase-like NAD-dependent aldehyde dehydrogenase
MSQLNVTSPFDGSPIKTINRNSADEVEHMLQTATALFKNRDCWLQLFERTEILTKLAGLLENEASDFAMLIAKEGGKPLIDAKVEVARAIDGIYLAIKELAHVMRGEEIPMGLTPASKDRVAFTTYEPIGVVVAVSAFNHPLNLIVHQVVPAIAVGCPVIVKPATNTPLNCLRFVELVHQAGLAKEWCQTCVCDNQTAEKLITDQRVAFLSFIGSARIGWWLKSKLAPGTRCALEHGGVAPVIVDENVDLDKIVAPLLKGSFYHAGQVCVSTQKIFAPKSIAETLAQKLADGAKKLKVGDATLPDTEVGPLITHAEVDRVHEWVTEAIDGGAMLLTGGKKISDSLYEPTVLLNPPNEAKVSTAEVFGPVVCVYSYEQRQDAIDLANSLDVAFQAAVFSNDIHVVNDTVKRLDASTVMVNDHTAFRVDWMPFAGRRHSGYGIGGIGYTMHDIVQHKMTVINNG